MNENLNSLIGMKLGRLLVISQDLKKLTLERGTHWICKCDCGKIVTVSRNNLNPFSKDGIRATRSCGCSRKNRKDRTEVLWKKAYCNQINNTSRKSTLNTLTQHQFKEIASKQCHYCDIPFSRAYKDNRWKLGKEIKMTDAEIRLNGIDRIDSLAGYGLGNCVSCCSNCSRAKNTMSQQKFSEYIKRVYEHFCK